MDNKFRVLNRASSYCTSQTPWSTVSADLYWLCLARGVTGALTFLFIQRLG
jgi:hypothetical protein